MKRKIKDFSQSPTELIAQMMNNFPTQAARQRVLIIHSIINAYYQTMTPSNCSSSFFASGIIPFNIQKVLSNKFVRMTEPNDQFPQERGISINSQIITSNSKRIEIANNSYQKQMESITQIQQYHYMPIEEWLSTGSEVILQKFPSILVETRLGIIICY